MMRKRKSNSKRDAMDFIEFRSEATRLERAVQWLRRKNEERTRSAKCRKEIIEKIRIGPRKIDVYTTYKRKLGPC